MEPRKRIRIGCSGWYYRDWRGRFYPPDLPQKRWFAHYAAHFDTVELNNPFYRLPTPAAVESWRAAAPPGFCYAVKMHRFLTHRKKLDEPAEPLARTLPLYRALGATLGPILYQLPPRFHANVGRLEALLAMLPRDLTHVFEFRDPSWLVDEVLALLEEHGASLCAHDMADQAPSRLAVGPVAYVRFHGAEGKYRGGYPEEALRGWSEWMLEQAASGRAVWAFFNNDIEAQAPADAQMLREIVSQAAR